MDYWAVIYIFDVAQIDHTLHTHISQRWNGAIKLIVI